MNSTRVTRGLSPKRRTQRKKRVQRSKRRVSKRARTRQKAGMIRTLGRLLSTRRQGSQQQIQPEDTGPTTAAPDTSVVLTDFLKKIRDKSTFVNTMAIEGDDDFTFPPYIQCYIESEVIQQSILTLCHAATKPASVPKAAEAAVEEADKRRREAEEATGELDTLFNNFRNGLVVFDDITLREIRQLGISPSPLAALLQVCEILMMNVDVMDLLHRFVASLVSMDPKTLSEKIFMVAQPDALKKYRELKYFENELTGEDEALAKRLAQGIDPDGKAAKKYEQEVAAEAELTAKRELTARREATAKAAERRQAEAEAAASKQF
jgi:hypothetical protein